MKPRGSITRFLAQFRSGSRTLKATLALYFLPISILPAIFLSGYATHVFEENTRQTIRRRAETERDAFIAEFQRFEKDLLDTVRVQRDNPRLLSAMRAPQPARLQNMLGVFAENVSIRIYSPSGRLVASRLAAWDHQVSFIAEAVLEKVRARGETRERFIRGEGQGITTVVRTILRDSRRLHGILEAQLQIGQKELASFKARREVDTLLLNKDLSVGAASFALPPEFVASFSKLPFKVSSDEPLVVNLGDVRFAAYLFELPAAYSRKLKDGYFVLFMSMTAADAAAGKLRVALIYLTVLLVLFAALLILVLSNRIVAPLELLVMGMKRIRTGRNEQIPTIDSPYEIEYLVHSFNEMVRNVADARRALEDKVQELHGANIEIKETQGALVQSAKMVSLGQLVAGVAHELNNPIGFISSNMHHLSEYVEKIGRLMQAYQKYKSELPPESQKRLAELEKDLEIEFILKDMVELTRSCVEGANRTKDIVLGLRTFSRIDQASFQSSDLHEGLRNTIRLLVTEFKDRVTIHEEFGVIPEVECNLSQMNQVFMNLLSNAAQAVEGKGDVWIRTRRDGDRVRIEIEDNGAGMSQEVLQKIFDPFFTTKKVGKGTGLGLSIAYNLVERHHGQIEVQSEVGRGTTFTIHLPIRQKGGGTAVSTG